jgi:hypothetical protein
MFRVGYFRLRLGYGKSYNFCLANFEVVWAKYFVVLIVKVLDHMQFQIFFSSQLLHIIQYMNSHILMKLVIY